MSKIVILLLCVVCAIADEAHPDKMGPPIPDSSPKPITTTTTTQAPTNGTTTTTQRPTNGTTTTNPTPSSTTQPTPPPTTKTTTSPTTKTTTSPTTPSTTSPTTPPTTPTPKPTPAPTPVGPPTINNYAGNYTGTNWICLMMKMAVQVELLDEHKTKINITDKVQSAVTCGNGSVETLKVSWGSNDLLLTFFKNNSKFEIQSVMAAIIPPGENLTTNYYHNKTEFSVSTKQSYKCAKDQALNLTNIYSNVTLAKLHISHLQYQAFVNKTAPQYDSAWYCDATNTPDVVPIIVGCVLAVLVVLVLVAYLFGRRRCQARGYLSM